MKSTVHLTPMPYSVLRYLGTLAGNIQFDSRLLYHQIETDNELQKTHNDWISFAQICRSDLAKAGSFEIKTSPVAGIFMMLNPDQASIFILFCITEGYTSFDELLYILTTIQTALPPARYCHPHPDMAWFVAFNMDIIQDVTRDEIIAQQHTLKQPSEGPEKKIERAFGKQLESQGIPVQYQVPCAYGQADIVTPDTIYEVKAFLDKKSLHEAIGQVLAYRACINPAAKAVVVGGKPKRGSVHMQLAQAVGVAVIIWDELPSDVPDHVCEQSGSLSILTNAPDEW